MRRQKKLTISATLSVLLLVGLAVCVRPLIAQLALSQRTSSPSSWMTEKWIGDDKPFAAARENIDSDFSHGRITVPYLSKLEAAWNQDERDPLKLFRWAYARYKAQSSHPALPPTPIPAEGDFNEVPSPHTYEYTRVRFLSEISLSRHRELMAVGKRMLAHNPNDFDVEYGLSYCFGESMSAEEKQAALAYADHLIQKYPNKPSVYTVKGGVYFSYWIDHRDKQDARDAIYWYQQYLRLAPANDEWRKQAESTVTLLQSRL
jgi:hypothetical protein